jgi:DNA topoisomerase II
VVNFIVLISILSCTIHVQIFDEILVNAADNKQRDKHMATIDVSIKEVKGSKKSKPGLKISIYNDGKGVPVQLHEAEKIYIPELIFGHLLTGSNFDDNQVCILNP